MQQKNLRIIALTILLSGSMIACGGENEKTSSSKETTTVQQSPKPETKPETKPASDDMSDIGVGPIKAFTLPAEIDQAMAAEGKKIFKAKCTACHKVSKKFIGPSPKGIVNRRNPAWIMNMILNPEKMVKEDPIAKALLKKYSAPMANQGLTEEDARKVLEYFRTL